MASTTKLKKSVDYCFICRTIVSTSDNKVSCFHVPSHQVERFKEIIPGISENSKLCNKHFDESDVVKGVFILGVFHPHKRWKLHHDAIPKYFLTPSPIRKRKLLCEKQLNFKGTHEKHRGPESIARNALAKAPTSVTKKQNKENIAPLRIPSAVAKEQNSVKKRKSATPPISVIQNLESPAMQLPIRSEELTTQSAPKPTQLMAKSVHLLPAALQQDSIVLTPTCTERAAPKNLTVMPASTLTAQSAPTTTAVAQQYPAPSTGYPGQHAQTAGKVVLASSWSPPAVPQCQQEAPAPSSLWLSPVSSQGPATYGEQMGQLSFATAIQQSAPTYSGPATYAQQSRSGPAAQQSAPAYTDSSASHGKQQQEAYNGPPAQQFPAFYVGPPASLGRQQQADDGTAAQQSAPAYADPSGVLKSSNWPAVQLAPPDQFVQEAVPNAPQSLGPSAYNGDAQVASPCQQYVPAQQQSYSAPSDNAVQPQAAYNPASGQQYSVHAVPDKLTAIPVPALIVQSSRTTTIEKTMASSVSTKMASTERNTTEIKIPETKLTAYISQGEQATVNVTDLLDSDMPFSLVTPTWTWCRKGFDIISIENASDENRVLCYGPVLHLKTVSLEDKGVYKCTSFSNEGSHIYFVELVIQHKPIVMSECLDLNKIACGEGETAKLVCRVRGNPGVTFSWTRDGVPLSNSDIKFKQESILIEADAWEATLTIGSVDSSDYGHYECIATNELGTLALKFALFNFCKPDPPRKLRVLNMSKDSVNLQWIPSFDGGLPSMYRIRYQQVGKESFRYADVYPPTCTAYLLDELLSDTEYQFEVMAFNEMGESGYSNCHVKARTRGSAEMKKLTRKAKPCRSEHRGSRNSCQNCNKFMSFTRTKLRTTNEVVCSKCLPFMNNLQRRLDARVKQLRLTRQHLKRTQEALDKSINSEEKSLGKLKTLQNTIEELKKETLEATIAILPKQIMLKSRGCIHLTQMSPT